MKTKKAIYAIILAFALTTFISCKKEANTDSESQATITSLQKQITELTANSTLVNENLIKFDTLDYTVFSNQEWTRLHESHAKNIKVNWPDGHFTTGIEKHIEDLKAMFVYAPDTRIKQHPIRFGSGQYTAVAGIMEGTFTKPMPIGEGKFIQPTGKSFKLPMATIGIWKNGVMIEEFLYWDNKTYMDQIGLGK
ncbi:polyketide cyclase [Flavobacterium cupreum]|uniref:Polyketide cyclase n=2 Tax=Flavobacterium TaxID=237 RepID=A0A4Y7UFV0_9FLAO|nr:MULTISPECIES: ester cyclase [Flavobacterium]RUT67921.1 polyketide cyclase [Flavobacterium cupreum]TCN59479.1 SnoaL-like polyketide cyclase [Flavobacterium circumlabens]TEB44778.1 polyketide cyclase [Flavobacterium circumlabens]